MLISGRWILQVREAFVPIEEQETMLTQIIPTNFKCNLLIIAVQSKVADHELPVKKYVRSDTQVKDLCFAQLECSVLSCVVSLPLAFRLD